MSGSVFKEENQSPEKPAQRESVNMMDFPEMIRVLTIISEALQKVGNWQKNDELASVLSKIEAIRDSIQGILWPSALGGGVSKDLIQGDKTGAIEKKHLIVNRLMRLEAQKRGIDYIDMGTDYHYPFYSSYDPTQKAIEALGKNPEAALHYPSSYGLPDLRLSFHRFMRQQFNVDVNSHSEIMVNTGASQAFDALSRAFSGKYVLLPQLSLPTVSTIAKGNGAEIFRLPTCENGLIDLDSLEDTLDSHGIKSVRFLYLNSPINPTGAMAGADYLQKLVEIAKRRKLLVVHDMDSWYTRHEGQKPVNILEIEGAKDCSVSIFSISKEFGLPGLRVGLLAGNSEVIDVVRVHNSIFCVMIPEICQFAAKEAIDRYHDNEERSEINDTVTGTLNFSLDQWRDLGWPSDALIKPQGGYKYLLRIPKNIEGEAGYSAAELFDFFLASRCYVKLSTSRSFNPANSDYIRVVLMQNREMLDEAFRRFREAGVSYTMELPPGIATEYSEFVDANLKSDF